MFYAKNRNGRVLSNRHFYPLLPSQNPSTHTHTNTKVDDARPVTESVIRGRVAGFSHPTILPTNPHIAVCFYVFRFPLWDVHCVPKRKLREFGGG